jgi:hypothetical protein
MKLKTLINSNTGKFPSVISERLISGSEVTLYVYTCYIGSICERLFSVVGVLVDKRRTSVISPEHIQQFASKCFMLIQLVRAPIAVPIDQSLVDI